MNPNAQPTRVESFDRSALAFFSNRRIRTRTYGGVGGAEPRGSPLSRSMARSGRSADNKLIGRNSFDYLLVESTGSWSRCHLQSLAWAGGRHRPLPITGVHKPATTRRAFARKWDELLSLPRPNSLQG